MTPLAITLEDAIPLIIAVIGSGALTTAITYYFLKPKTKGEAAKLRAESDNVYVTTQDKIILGWQTYATQLEQRITSLEQRLDLADRREHIVAVFVYEASSWMHKAWNVMSPQQQQETGEPPKADPTLFDGLLTALPPRGSPPFHSHGGNADPMPVSPS